MLRLVIVTKGAVVLDLACTLFNNTIVTFLPPSGLTGFHSFLSNANCLHTFLIISSNRARMPTSTHTIPEMCIQIT